MAWINVNIWVDNQDVPNVINIDTIVRIGPAVHGTHIHFIDGTAINVTDDFHEIGQLIAQAGAVKET